MTSKEITYKALKPRKWIAGYDLEAQGGSLRRLRELREDGYEIKSRRIPGEQAFEYRMVGRSK
jgi:hypothetical protein